jgi:sortase A
MSAADWGGPVVRQAPLPARNWMRAAAPGVAWRDLPDESSPIGGAEVLRNERTGASTRFTRAALLSCIAVLAGGGLLAFGHGAYIHAKAQLAQVLLHAAWDRTRDTGLASKPWPWADTHPVARLLAPAQHADLLVLAGASGRTLAFGPGHLDGSAQPGDTGNAVITAHRDTHFRFLKTANPGDAIVVERADGHQRRFRIRTTYVADYRNLRLPRDTAVPTLTLVTCFPFDALDAGGPLRYIVVAEAA